MGQIWGKGISYLFDNFERHDGGIWQGRAETAAWFTCNLFRVFRKEFIDEERLYVGEGAYVEPKVSSGPELSSDKDCPCRKRLNSALAASQSPMAT